jgi:hypothetical protein
MLLSPETARKSWGKHCGILASMKLRTANRILACILILVSSLSLTQSRAWICDGRVCSTTDVCCCQSPSGQQDVKCSLGSEAQPQSSICGSGCECQLVVKSDAQSASAPRTSIDAAQIMALVPLAATVYVPATLSTSLLSQPETRGPPRGSLSFGPLSLRAPPTA